MSAREIVSAVLLYAGVAVQLLCCAGLVAIRSPFARLHCLGPATLLGPLLIAAAVVTREAFNQAGVKAILVALVFLVTGPVMTHVLGRAMWVRHGGAVEEEADR